MSKMLIIGAGASTAVTNGLFPTMDNFFEKTLQCSEEDRNSIATVFSNLDSARAFVQRNIQCENRGMEFAALSGLTTPKQPVTNIIRDEYLKLLRERFTSAPDVFKNLELVMDRCSSQRNSRTYLSLMYLINYVYGRSDVEIQKKADEIYHPLFDHFIGKEEVCTLVSFNYDVVFDNSLVSWLASSMKVTDKGLASLFTRNDGFSGKIDSARFPDWFKIEGPFEDPPPYEPFGTVGMKYNPRLRLLKPHGSLSFCHRTKDDEKKECCLLLDKGNFSTFPNFHTRIIDYEGNERFPEVAPLIVPPTRLKIKSYPILYEAERTFLEALGNPNTKRIVIIGWSLPPTDVDHKEAIRGKILERGPNAQIEELIVLDKKESEHDEHFDRLEELFQPKMMKRSHTGFGKTEIELLLI